MGALHNKKHINLHVLFLLQQFLFLPQTLKYKHQMSEYDAVGNVL